MLPTNPLLNATTPAGPHLPVGLLRQYAAGTLAPAAQHRVEAHTLACPRCADILSGLLQTPAATTDQAVAQLQQRLRQRVQQQAAPARYDREEQRNRWLIPQLAAAAALLLGLVAGGWWAWQQRHTEQLATPTVAVAPKAAPTVPAAPAAAAPTESLAVATAPLVAARSADYASRPVRRRPTPLADERSPFSRSRAALVDSAATAPTAATPTPTSPAADIVANAPVAAADSDQLRVAKNAYSRPIPSAASEGAPSRKALMPAAPPIAPAPAGGYSALREKLRRAATEFQPEEGERPMSGSVQLRLTIGADGKIEQIRVLHGLRADYDEEAQRLVCEGPGWIPGISGGRRAAQTVDITVPF